MNQEKKKNITLTISSVAIALSVIAISMQIFVMAKEEPSADEKYEQMLHENFHNFAAPMPKSVSFCGEKVPIDNTFVRAVVGQRIILSDLSTRIYVYHIETCF